MAALIRNLAGVGKFASNAGKTYFKECHASAVAVCKPFHTTPNNYKTKESFRRGQSRRIEKKMQKVSLKLEGKLSYAKPRGQ
jgi:hypothetical protein